MIFVFDFTSGWSFFFNFTAGLIETYTMQNWDDSKVFLMSQISTQNSQTVKRF